MSRMPIKLGGLLGKINLSSVNNQILLIEQLETAETISLAMRVSSHRRYQKSIMLRDKLARRSDFSRKTKFYPGSTLYRPFIRMYRWPRLHLLLITESLLRNIVHFRALIPPGSPQSGKLGRCCPLLKPQQHQPRLQECYIHRRMRKSVK